jgi:isoleucyl-tRNA synthetase
MGARRFLLMVASAAPWLSKRLDPGGILEVRRRFFSTLQNSYGFFREYARIDGFDPEDPAVPALAERPEIDRWLVSRTQSAVGEARARFADHDLTGAARALEEFVVDELSNWYIRRNRRRFWKGETGSDKLSAFASLYAALEGVALCIAPLAPFTSELLWRRLRPGAGSVHAALYPEAEAAAIDLELEGQVEVCQRVVAMGRALRERAGVRTRQPLRALHVRSSDPRSLELLASDFATRQVLEELNVKAWGSLESDDGQLCRLVVKPAFRTLGKRLGPRMKAAAAAIGALDADAAGRLRGGGTVVLPLEGGELELGPDDVEIQVESRADFDVEADGRFVVWLDLELDRELRDEGLAREVVNRVNALRKARGLAVEERVRLHLASASEDVRRALEAHRELIASETLAVELRLAPTPASTLERGLEPETWDLGEGRALDGAIERL